MILSQGDIRERIPDIVRDIFRRYVPDAPDDCIQRVSERSGIPLEKLGRENSGAFLECMSEELSRFTEGWKAKFVTGVIRQMIDRAGDGGG